MSLAWFLTKVAHVWPPPRRSRTDRMYFCTVRLLILIPSFRSSPRIRSAPHSRFFVAISLIKLMFSAQTASPIRCLTRRRRRRQERGGGVEPQHARKLCLSRRHCITRRSQKIGSPQAKTVRFLGPLLNLTALIEPHGSRPSATA